jgi:hypothetical protein
VGVLFILSEGGTRMRTLQSEFKKHGFKKQKRKKKKSEGDMSRWEIEDLMGVGRRKYRRGNGGSYKQY